MEEVLMRAFVAIPRSSFSAHSNVYLCCLRHLLALLLSTAFSSVPRFLVQFISYLVNCNGSHRDWCRYCQVWSNVCIILITQVAPGLLLLRASKMFCFSFSIIGPTKAHNAPRKTFRAQSMRNVPKALLPANGPCQCHGESNFSNRFYLQS